MVGREPGSVATRLGEQEKTTARGLDHRAGSVARPGGRESPFTSSFWFFNVLDDPVRQMAQRPAEDMLSMKIVSFCKDIFAIGSRKPMC